MPIKKDYETPSTGAIASYHVAQMVTLDKISKGTSVALYSYLSADACAAGKAPMYQQQIMITALPDSGADAFAFAEQEIVAVPPTDEAASLNLSRYAFAGAEIVA
ncbi:hypothetical protein M3I53_01020 [Paraburkholderia sp. CNPSo 3272]|uniref:hypothetical protein n=1 Tax=Paraburkholderia sp. CNPSo 3272 TaxID=2940931 RepID=UPI0020B718EA|nr:hypothetical protein [Paraburkholderia sp. CNPSo 3272]MCP3721718.1 hypothetical protein [Paraburkholderia sp. CNPSo 3272]